MSDAVDVVTTDWYQEDLQDLPELHQHRITERLVAFRDKGWRQAVEDQTVKYLRDGIHELRVLGRGAAFRVLFFLVPGRVPRVVVVTTCVAKSVMTKRRRFAAEIERACARRDSWLEQQRKGWSR
jgi:phage-related protein